MKALLIGFEYLENKTIKSLPGIPVDLYQAYNHALKITKSITVFTDVSEDHKTDILKQAILNNYADSNLLSFIEDIKERSHNLFKSKKEGNYTSNNFEEIFIKSIKDCNKLFLYYSGHAKNGNIILPDKTHVPLTHLRDLMNKHCSNEAEIVVILDCCQSNGMELPYSFHKNVYSSDLTPLNIFKLNSYNFTDKRIICLSATQIDQDSNATRSGSLFTRKIFDLIKSEKQISIKKIDAIITTSYPEQSIWSWFVKGSKNNLSIFVDKSIIFIKLNNCKKTITDSKSVKNYFRYLDKNFINLNSN
jgi:hypothetical protein